MSPMRRASRLAVAVLTVALTTVDVGATSHALSAFGPTGLSRAQTRKPPARKPAPAPATKKEPAEIVCPAPLGVGIRTRVSFCEVLAAREPSAGVLVRIPPHRGPAALTFDLHNLHLYSEEQVKAKRAFT